MTHGRDFFFRFGDLSCNHNRTQRPHRPLLQYMRNTSLRLSSNRQRVPSVLWLNVTTCQTDTLTQVFFFIKLNLFWRVRVRKSARQMTPRATVLAPIILGHSLSASASRIWDREQRIMIANIIFLSEIKVEQFPKFLLLKKIIIIRSSSIRVSIYMFKNPKVRMWSDLFCRCTNWL